MASPRKILSTSTTFDDVITAFASFIIAQLQQEADPDLDINFNLYQDFTFDRDTPQEGKDLIIIETYKRNDLTDFSTALQRVHFVRSRCYGNMAKQRGTLFYFNKIIFQS